MFALVNLVRTILKMLKGLNVIPNMVDEAHIFDSVEECIMWMHEPGHIENKLADPSQTVHPLCFYS